ncbi:uncharacterized protein at2g33490 [Phtheirospermum japonicum]|uniref:Uncharacterized protein at2g33490 n=1 Tax=Phtheirospermum japonicum TaxID=374723 RepID=A0A830D336_9LAMI|nr:uncharacterized protein at2g33490 [Phtheirospermum japonicum]
MKSPLGKLRKLGLSKSEPEENWDHHISAHIDGLTQAAKDMKDMRTCYDGLLSAAAATANSAYEFSESLLEMGSCLLEKTAVHDDGESGGTLSLLGRVQLELQKLVDSYRSQIIMTITHPSESLLSELRKVEEMKLQCDEKRETFEYMVGQFREKGKSRHGKGETFTSDQLQAVREEYDEAARLCVFRVASLKQGQSRSLLTQAARHHAAQLNFFRRGLQSLEAVEPHIRNVAEKQHIDYELSELNDGEEGGDGEKSFETNEDGELSSSHSAPLYAEKFDYAERIREMRTSVQKFNRHVLPTPDDAKGSILTSSIPPPSSGSSKNQWHSSPLDIDKQKKPVDEENISTNKKHFLPLPRPLTEVGPTAAFDTQSVSDGQKIKRQAFSGPLVGKSSSSNKPPSLNTSHNAPPPPLVSSPKISELHELPRPPDSFGPKYVRYGGGLEHSAPLVGRHREVLAREGSRLPLPQLTVSRSFSIPSSSERTRAFHSGKLLESSHVLKKAEEAPSPPLTPISLSHTK